ncbi:MAG TPA: hypothetical protein VFP16_05180, partial [Vicinamibacterales bacterium]|nr:hypothetical protein [Vicinamibacterales bacterium]
VERLEPFARLERLDLRGVFGCGIAHESSRERASGQQRGSGPHATPGPSCGTASHIIPDIVDDNYLF